jgi:hypothetical protein
MAVTYPVEAVIPVRPEYFQTFWTGQTYLFAPQKAVIRPTFFLSLASWHNF